MFAMAVFIYSYDYSHPSILTEAFNHAPLLLVYR